MKIYSQKEFQYVVSSISGYTDQVGGELLSKALIGATTAKHANIRLGIKGVQALNLLDSNPSFQSGVCGWNPSGTTTFKQHYIAVCPEKLNEALCYKDLYTTYQSMLMNPGEVSETVPFEEAIMALKVKQIQQRIEQKLWQATKAGGDCFDGLKKLISTGSTIDGGSAGVGIGVSTNGTAFSTTAAYGADGNAITEVDKLINALDDNALSREDLVVFMSYANFRIYLQTLTRANFFQNYIGSTDVTGQMEATHPNTNIKVVPTIGLNGSNQVTIGPKEFTVVGFDLLDDHEKINAWYSVDFDELRFRANYNYGVTIATFGSTAYFATNNLA